MTLDRATIQELHRGPALHVTLCGARYHGRQQRPNGQEPLIIFTDPVTHSTLALPESECTIGNVGRKLRATRAAYRDAMNTGGT